MHDSRHDSQCTLAVTDPGQRLELRGRLDVHAAADVRLALADALALGTEDLLLDLSGIEALDATGLGVLVGTHRRADRSGRRLVLTDCSGPVRRVLFLTRLERVLFTTQQSRVA